MLSKFASLACACALFSTAYAPAALASAASSIRISHPYVTAVAPGQTNSAAFLVLKNTSAHDHALVSASSPAAEIVQLHTHLHVNGMMEMRQVKQIPIKAHSKTMLKHGGFHIMLIHLRKPLKPGEQVPLTLTFEDGSHQKISAPVVKLSDTLKSMPMKMDRHH
ncbi:MAG TPA: hypothetical protein DEP05_03415 [Betaproteobacteria bacterium]|nr:hypothetical protein [Betaproteobacteria bacterium]